MSLPERGELEPAALDRFAITREDMLDSYAAPYRRWLPLALKQYGVHRYVAADVVLGACWILGAVTGYERLVPVAATLTIFALIITAAVTARALTEGVEVIRARTAEWRPGKGDLAKVRRNRPHAVEADLDIAHDEYAVAVSDDGRLVTFAYVPLMAGERPARSSVLIPGKPRYEAVEVDTDRFDPDDAVVAAEQLAAAQQHAAELEASAIDRGRAELAEREAAIDLAVETQSTAAALRRITGQ